MQSENFDNKVKDILNQPPPGNDNPNWDKMERMLDKHLPQKKDDRRRFLFLLFFLLLAGSAAFIIWKNGNEKKNEIVAAKAADKNSNNTVNEIKDESQTKAGDNTTVIATKDDIGQQITADKNADPANNLTVTNKNITTNSNTQISTEPEFIIADGGVSKTSKKKNNNTVGQKEITKARPTKNITDEPVIEKKNDAISDNQQKEINTVNTEKKEKTIEPIKEAEKEQSATEKEQEAKHEEVKQQELPVAKKSDNKKQKTGNSFLSNFFLTVSAGPDISGVGGNTGEMKLATGFGIGYNISKRLAIRTGYFTVRKVYSSKPEDYHPENPAFWNYYPNLKNIDANCKVNEIPVLIDYTISNRKKESWFVSGGLSTLLMKEETYEYYFKPNYSPNYITYSRTYKDQNKHYFSVLALSGGYTRKLSRHVSLRAEPYARIALDGVGFGKVNLNSGGILVSAIIKPFAGNKNSALLKKQP